MERRKRIDTGISSSVQKEEQGKEHEKLSINKLRERYAQINPPESQKKPNHPKNQVHVGVDASYPIFTEALDEDDSIEPDEDDFEPEFLDADFPEDAYDESPDYDQMDGDEEEEITDYDSDYIFETVTSETFRHMACAEINEVDGKLFISLGKIDEKSKQKEIRQITEEIALQNRDFILGESLTYKKLEQTKLAEQIKVSRSKLNRLIHSNYIAFPNGIIYPLSMFFSDTPGNKGKETNDIQGFIDEILQKEKSVVEQLRKENHPLTIDFLYSDKKIAEEYLRRLNVASDRKMLESCRRKMQRYRESRKIKTIEERFEEYKK